MNRTIPRVGRTLLASLFLLAGCAGPAAAPDALVVIAPDVTLRLPAPGLLGREVDAVQLVQAHFQNQETSFEARIEIKGGEMRLVASDMLGRKLMSIRWNGVRLESERASWVPAGLRPENVLADIVLAFWPEDAVRAAITGASLHGGVVRSLERGGDVIMTIEGDRDRWNGQTSLSNLVWHYRLDIRTAEVGS